jgi:anthranilate phosphoribosyltransferase
VLGNLGGKSAFVVYGEGSYDEISIVGPTRVSQLQEGEVRTYDIAPEDFGLKRATLEDIKGGDVFDNARIVRRVLEGEGGPREDMVALNAAAAFIAAGLSPDFPHGIKLARKTIGSGKALKKLNDLIAKSKSFGGEP